LGSEAHLDAAELWSFRQRRSGQPLLHPRFSLHTTAWVGYMEDSLRRTDYVTDALVPTHSTITVFRLLGLSLLFTAGGMVIGTQLHLPFLLSAPGSFGLLLVLWRVRNQSPRNQVMLYAYATSMGVMLESVVPHYWVLGLGDMLVAPIAYTAGISLIAGLFGIATKRYLSRLGGVLLVALIGLIVAILADLFIHLLFFNVLAAGFGELLFIVFIGFDTQRLKRKDPMGMDDVILLTVALYMDLVNLWLLVVLPAVHPFSLVFLVLRLLAYGAELKRVVYLQEKFTPRL
jgi:modulator of FtsH protease